MTILSFKSLIGNKDVSWWDGVTRTFTRRTSTGGSLTLNKIGHHVDVLEAYGDGENYTTAVILKAINDIGSSNKVTLVFQPGTWTISSAVTFTSNIAVYCPNGATFTKSGSGTMTFNGPFSAGLYPVFSGFAAGEVTFGTGAVKEILPQWWGLSPSASQATNAAALNAAFVNTTIPIYIPEGTYETTALTAINHDIVVRGAGRGTVLKFNTTGNSIDITRTSYKIAHFSNFSMKSVTNTPAIFINNNFDNTLIENLFFESTSATIAIQNSDAYGLTIRKCKWSFFTGTPIVLKQAAADADYSYNVNLQNIDISNNTGNGIIIYGGGPIAISDSVIEQCSLGAIKIDPTANTTYLLGLELRNCYFETNTSYDIQITDSSSYWAELLITNSRFVVPAGITLGAKSRVAIISSVSLSGTQTITGSTSASATLINCNTAFAKSGTFYWSEFGFVNSDSQEFISYTPTWGGDSGNPAIGDGTLTGKYVRIGNTVTVHINMTAGSTTTFGTGNWFFSLPFTPAQTGQLGQVYMLDTGTAERAGRIRASSAGKNFYPHTINGTSADAKINATAPWTWAAGDMIDMSITYVAQD